ncbi:MAG: U32 family peptidase [Clostridia bacterium]|jgi:putative protease|nr:U32 family peptidase [Clostridia bacterium]
MIELLAPAGNKESFYAAVNSGANAVYLGLKDFNARGKIENFTIAELKEIISYAHLFNVKVYLVVNTLIKDSEAQAFLDIIYDTSVLSIDAYLVQDFGMCSLIKKYFPNIEIHASTQMGIHNYLGAIIAENIGFKRIVLSRETSLLDIKLIKEHTKLELEFFIQGALCVSFSGNCYMSSILAENSGNRGKCLQFCRLPYTASVNGKEIKQGYLLSAKDLCLMQNMKELIDTGITSFKIEGRARRSSYVAQSVQTYRKILDDSLKFTNDDINNLKLAFNRGNYCNAYLNPNAKSNIIESNIQGHTGIEIGVVTNFECGKRFNVLTINSNAEIGRSDGLKFIKNGLETASIGVIDVKKTNTNEYTITTTTIVNIGDSVYLILDKSKENESLSIRRKLTTNATFIAKNNKKAELILYYNDVKISVFTNEILEKAQNQPLSQEQVKEQLNKTGAEIIDLNITQIILDSVFMAKSQLNNLRRKGIEELKVAILDEYSKKLPLPKNKLVLNELTANIKPFAQSKIVCLNTIESLSKQLVAYCNILAYSPDVFTSANIKIFIEKAREVGYNDTIYLYLPPIANFNDLTIINQILTDYKDLGIIANNIYALTYALNGRNVIAGPMLNLYNNYSVNELKKYNIISCILSFELTPSELENINRLTDLTCYTFVGNIPLMTLCHCPVQNIYGSDCKNCKYSNKITYTNKRMQIFKIKRKKLSNCYFSVVESGKNSLENINKIKSNMFINLEDLSNMQIVQLLNKQASL